MTPTDIYALCGRGGHTASEYQWNPPLNFSGKQLINMRNGVFFTTIKSSYFSIKIFVNTDRNWIEISIFEKYRETGSKLPDSWPRHSLRPWRNNKPSVTKLICDDHSYLPKFLRIVA